MMCVKSLAPGQVPVLYASSMALPCAYQFTGPPEKTSHTLGLQVSGQYFIGSTLKAVRNCLGLQDTQRKKVLGCA